jgi:NADH-quinone oxidoreductase subunit G
VDQADALVIIGSNPRVEAPVLNARIRKRWLAGGFKAGVIGPAMELTYSAAHLGAGPQDIAAAASFLEGAQRPMILLGRGALQRADGAAVLAAAWELARASGALREDWHGFNLLHLFGGQVGALDVGFVPGEGGQDMAGMLAGGVDALWLLGASDFDAARIPAGTFVVYQGHHGEAAAARADVILPGAAYTEKEGTYVNTEGRVQRGRLATMPPGEAREDWKIIRAASQALGVTLPYDTLDALRAELAATHGAFRVIGAGPRPGCTDDAGPSGGGSLDAAPFALPIANFWQCDPISRASPTMANAQKPICRRNRPWRPNERLPRHAARRLRADGRPGLALLVPVLLSVAFLTLASARCWPRCRCGAARTWSAPSACCSPSPTPSRC